jgi:DMSO/TMAO reductase YedYZ heme-binding membrane subunit
MTTNWMWFYTRGTGVVALLLLTGTVALGIVGALRWSNAYWPRFVTQGLHRNLSLLAVAFVGLHVITSVADGYVPLRWRDAIVPFVSAYRPLWVGLGAIAFDLVIALIITSLLRVRLGLGSWRAVHWLAYVAWPIAVAHALGNGTDRGQEWMLALTVACLVTVFVAAGLRLGRAASR